MPQERSAVLSAKGDSPYYPPRAGWLSRRLLAWYRLRRSLERLHYSPVDEPPSRARLAVWLCVPGKVFFDRPQDGFGKVCGALLLGLWLAGLAVYLTWIGEAISAAAFLAMAIAQSVSAVAALQIAAHKLGPVARRLFAASGALVVTLLCSSVFQTQLVHRVVLPITMRGSTVLINPWSAKGVLPRGEWVAYRLYGAMGFGRIWGHAGDTVRFHDGAITVNDVAYQRPLGLLPRNAELVVAKGCYFIWSEDIAPPHWQGVNADNMVFYGVVKMDSVIGPAYRRWLWREQVLPPLVALKDWTPPLPRP